MIARLSLFLFSLFAAVTLSGIVADNQFSRGKAAALLAIAFSLTFAFLETTFRRPHSNPNTVALSIQRVFHKSLAIGVGSLLVLAVASIQATLGANAATVFLEDFAPIWISLPLLIPTYVILCERVTGISEDAHLEAGATLAGQRAWRPREHKQLLLRWLVKAFFLPLMYGHLVLVLNQLFSLAVTPDPTTWFVQIALAGLAVDLMVATVGYLTTGPLFGREIRSVDESVSGWVVCLVCYAPFHQYTKLFLEQRDQTLWSDWLNPGQALYWIWAALLVCSWTVYWLSSIAFGLRFSNLTYRGLIDRGPYKYVKHPAYVSKNVYWWLHTVPFVGVASTLDMMVNVASLSTVSLIYYLRAKTEERHLMKYPEYAEYARRLEQKSLHSKLRQWFGRHKRLTA